MIKWITSLQAGIVAMVAAMFAIASRKAGTVTAGLATLVALTVVFVACINALLQMAVGAVTAAEGMWAARFIAWFVPVNAAFCAATIVSARICRAAYDLGRKKTDIVVYGN